MNHSHAIKQKDLSDNSKKADKVRPSKIFTRCMLLTGHVNVKGNKKQQFFNMAGSNGDFGKKHLSLSTATVQGHLHKQRQNLQSTKTMTMEIGPDEKETDENNIFSTITQPHTKCNQVAYVLINQDELQSAYQDLTG